MSNGMMVKVDPTNHTNMVGLMDNYNNFDMFYGKNENGEEISVSINKDNVVIRTRQSNGWERVNTYYRDGSYDETFEGKWK